MSGQHTPGPWMVEPDYRPAGRYSQHEEIVGYNIISSTSQIVGEEGITGAEPWNANLIAAAPELLEALRAVVRVADRDTTEFKLARAAIAKAEGRA